MRLGEFRRRGTTTSCSDAHYWGKCAYPWFFELILDPPRASPHREAREVLMRTIIENEARLIRPIAALLGLVLFGGLFGALRGDHEEIAALGVLTIPYNGGNFTSRDGDCEGTGGYSDLTVGAEVNVYDRKGVLLQSGSVSASRVAEGECRLLFLVPNVPEADLYQVEVSDRGKLTVQPEDMNDISFTIGG